MPVHLVDHPLVHDALAELRDKATPPAGFRRAAKRITTLLAAEALRDIPSVETTVDTPIGEAKARRVTADVVVVPILRAGLSMLDAVLTLAPAARVGHVGLQRDETTARAALYYSRLPSRIVDSFVIVVDPMLATGGSAARALEILAGAGVRQPRLVCIVAAPEGIAHVERSFPGTAIFTCAIDAGLNARQFIVPGLGDFGDRLYGTE